MQIWDDPQFKKDHDNGNFHVMCDKIGQLFKDCARPNRTELMAMYRAVPDRARWVADLDEVYRATLRGIQTQPKPAGAVTRPKYKGKYLAERDRASTLAKQLKGLEQTLNAPRPVASDEGGVPKGAMLKFKPSAETVQSCFREVIALAAKYESCRYEPLVCDFFAGVKRMVHKHRQKATA